MFILKEDDCILVSISQGCDDSDHFRLEDMNAVHVTNGMMADGACSGGWLLCRFVRGLVVFFVPVIHAYCIALSVLL